jgi:thiol:disulfide interchange protein DsbC
MKKSLLVFFLLLVLASPLHAADPAGKESKQQKQQAADPLPKVRDLPIVKTFLGDQIKAVSAKDLGNLYELVVAPPGGEKQVFYVTKDGAYAILGGHLLDKQKTDLTKERLEEVNRVDVSKLPVQDAIVIKKGSGVKKLYEFTDVDCPYCRKASEWLKTQTDYTLYVFLFPLDMHPKAHEKSVKILCDKDPATAFDLAQSDKELTADKCETGEKILQKHKTISAEVGVSGTPLFISGEGTRWSGFAQKPMEAYLKK